MELKELPQSVKFCEGHFDRPIPEVRLLSGSRSLCQPPVTDYVDACEIHGLGLKIAPPPRHQL